MGGRRKKLFAISLPVGRFLHCPSGDCGASTVGRTKKPPDGTIPDRLPFINVSIDHDMNRRGFFSSLFQSTPQIFFFGVQVVCSTISTDTSWKRLRSLIENTTDVESPRDKMSLYKQIAAILLENKPYWEYGYWDYLTEASEAQSEFHEWVSEISASLATEAEERGASIDEAHRLSSDKFYIAVTVAFILEYEHLQSVTDILDNIPEDEYWTSAGFVELLEAVKRIDYEYCLKDAVFLMPGTEEDGFSWEDVHSADWSYLKPLSL